MNFSNYNRAASSISEKMIKVNHAGENGAVNIYRGQQITGYFTNYRKSGLLNEFENHEKEHRDIFRNYLSKNKIRKCFS